MLQNLRIITDQGSLPTNHGFMRFHDSCHGFSWCFLVVNLPSKTCGRWVWIGGWLKGTPTSAPSQKYLRDSRMFEVVILSWILLFAHELCDSLDVTCDFSWHSWNGWSPPVAKCPKASKHFSSAILILDRTGSGIKVLQDMWLVQKYHVFSIPNSINQSLGPSWHSQELAGLTSPECMDKASGIGAMGWMKCPSFRSKERPLTPQNYHVLGIVHPYPSKHPFFLGFLGSTASCTEQIV